MREHRTNMIAANKATLLAALAAHGLTSATIEYSGGGDSGQVDEVVVAPEKPGVLREMVTVKRVQSEYVTAEQRWDHALRDVSLSLRTALVEFADAVIDSHVAGWEDNEGGRGTVTLDTETGDYTLEHNSYYTECDVSTFTG